jgi:hypothetical protein
MLTSSLQALITKCKEDGWAVGSGTIGEVKAASYGLGLKEATLRQSESPVTSRRPVPGSDERPDSLSSRHGEDAQPLHSEGAYLANPPDYIVLARTSISSVPTLIWPGRRTDSRMTTRLTDAISHGVFLVTDGVNMFYSTAGVGGRLRYDPGCMVPCDARAREAAEFFAGATASAATHTWSTPYTVLVLNNRRVLHARAAADEGPERELRLAFYAKDGQR